MLKCVTTGILKEWCPEVESNHRHKDFQSFALPTELSGRARFRMGNYKIN